MHTACIGGASEEGEGRARVRLWVYSLYDPLGWTSAACMLSRGERTHGIETGSGRGAFHYVVLCNNQAMFAVTLQQPVPMTYSRNVYTVTLSG